ncbi:hypothetical protein scyTo_0004954 [Scyliorhinus torazame]|uniref:Uncharacterized protein n=1 Tax=Scyliorhinus torazame TaxID=75743 RepID=A0A401NZR3_SCYTO|nr:hypothetical protein [Scyliorhinus torazame]
MGERGGRGMGQWEGVGGRCLVWGVGGEGGVTCAAQFPGAEERSDMEMKLWLVLALLVGTAVVYAQDDDDDADIVEDEDDESPIESDPTPSTPPPKVTYRAPVPIGQVHFSESFDKGTLERYERHADIITLGLWGWYCPGV